MNDPEAGVASEIKPHRLSLASDDPNGARLEELRRLFPDGVHGRGVDFDRLRQALGDAVDEGRERYGLSWSGKVESIRAMQAPSTGTLLPDRERSLHFDAARHVMIEGENLEVLKLLQKSYYGKVKPIYIDPPYNTGNSS